MQDILVARPWAPAQSFVTLRRCDPARIGVWSGAFAVAYGCALLPCRQASIQSF